MAKILTFTLVMLVFLICSARESNAQTTAFTYQGSLKEGGNPANGIYDFVVALYDAESGGSQVGTGLFISDIVVTNGIFSFTFNTGNEYPGANRFLDIRVRPDGSGPYTALTPRQRINSSPYAVRSLTATTAEAADTFFANTLGIGTTTPERKLHVAGSASQEIMIESTDVGGRKWTLQSSSAGNGGRFEIVDRTAVASRLAILDDGSTGIGTVAPTDRLDVNGTLRVRTLGAATATTLCRTATNQIASCTSSRKYKTDIAPFSAGLDVVKRLEPVSFNWTSDKSRDLGLVAEEVAKVDPLLVTYDRSGEAEGVKYDRISVVLVNAIKEQQIEIEALKAINAQQQAAAESQQRQNVGLKKQVNDLRAVVCSIKPDVEICRIEGEVK